MRVEVADKALEHVTVIEYKMVVDVVVAVVDVAAVHFAERTTGWGQVIVAIVNKHLDATAPQ